MELKVTYKKLANGNIEAELNVMDKGDYLTCQIFGDGCKHVSGQYMGVASRENYKTFLCDKAENIVLRVEEFILSIMKSLSEWRAIQVPKSRTYKI